MPLLIRKIERNKWRKLDDGYPVQPGAFQVEAVQADAITVSLRTRGNTLSLWKVDSDEELEDAILAIVSLFDKADAIDIVKIDSALIDEKLLEYRQTPGDTAYEVFKNNHYNVVDMTYRKLGLFAEIIINCLDNEKCQRIGKNEIKAIISKGILSGKIRKDDLKQKLVADCGI